MRFLAAVVLVLVAAPTAAQSPDPISGYVIDLRGATTGLPTDTAFFPHISEETVVPARGFGFDVGGHVYLFPLGPSRVGIGVSYGRMRGTSPGVVARVRTLAPQVSFNFGSVNGWSYLSAGYGRVAVDTRVDGESGTLTSDSGALAAVNVGGGARWFLARRLAAGFDLRLHRASGPPKASLFSASIGLSVR